MLDIYEVVTNRILTQLKAGQIPWRKTWKLGLPTSLASGKEYRGINILMLSLSGFSSRYWLTYRQALSLGGYVRKGEKSSTVVYWKWNTDEEMQKAREKLGKESVCPCVPFVSSVFNLEQVEGVKEPEDGESKNKPLETAELMLELMPVKPEILHAVTADPVYERVSDRITLPHLSQFENADEYYSTLFHELTHSTGHEKRLNRFDKEKGEILERYSFEELVAEFGAAFLCGFAGIGNETSEALQASYIEGWSRALRGDPHLLLRAASAAQRAADYIRGKNYSEEVAEAA